MSYPFHPLYRFAHGSRNSACCRVVSVLTLWPLVVNNLFLHNMLLKLVLHPGITKNGVKQPSEVIQRFANGRPKLFESDRPTLGCQDVLCCIP